MRIAAIYDVHGNLPALEAVLDDVAAEDFDGVVVGGDVLPGPMPVACLERLLALSLPTRFLLGNGEVDVLRFRDGEAPSRVPEAFHPGMRWVADALDEGAVQALRDWPSSVRVDVPGLGDALFCHATPRDENAIFTKRTPEEALRPIFERVGAAVVVCGHTHMQFDRTVGDVRVVNAGSVGMPFGATGAFWAVVGPDDVELRSTSYDLEAATELIEETGYPDAGLMRLCEPPTEEEMLAAFEAAAVR